ncbi:GtrA family protein [Desulfurococcus mucosus DSM 2162]|uniref:GtrA family protein n=1 Tax=Desulfurococcus mucosus (strain ATCC 35584 / DSM 2162 / JCM 9187 / O7/1) TaxID=765177 RepID=E8R8Z8_DESM0|nr:GtrA family protein [Desulfurococcus mucosus DSM 2162]
MKPVYVKVLEKNGLKLYVLKGLEDLANTLEPGEANVVLLLDTGVIDRIAFKLLGIPAYFCMGKAVIGFTTSREDDAPPCESEGHRNLFMERDGGVKLKLYSQRLPRILALPLSEVNRVARFIAVGASGVAVNLAVAELSHRLLQGNPLIANPIASTAGFEASVLWNFTLHEEWTFKDAGLSSKGRLVRLIKYHLASIASWMSQVFFATVMPIYLGTPFWLGQAVGVLVGFTVNFILGYIYTWSWSRL